MHDVTIKICITGSEFVCFWRDSPHWARAFYFTSFLNHTQWRTTVGRTPLDEWSARRGDLFLTTHNTHNRQTFMTLLGFETTISAGERPQTYAFDSAVTGDRERYWMAVISTQTQWQVFYKNGGFSNSCGQAKRPRESSATPKLENQVSYIWNRLHVLLFVMM